MLYHMRKASVRDLRYRFSVVEALLSEGQKIQITKRKRVIAHLTPVKTAASSRRPDFLGRLRKIYGNKVLKTTGAELLAQDRDRY
jgi:antitoxin (DNA-binding transcriptional repressor) of toxin-antitoxin stability system